MITAYTPAEREALVEHYRPWIREVFRHLRLTHWDIRINSEPPDDDDKQAEIAQWTCAHEADLWLGDRFFVRPPLYQAEIIAHEGLHLHMKPQKLVIANVLDILGHGGTVGGLIGTMARDAEETVVDDLGKILAPFLPPPPAPQTTAPELPDPEPSGDLRNTI